MTGDPCATGEALRRAVRTRHPVRSKEVDQATWRWQDTAPARTDAPAGTRSQELPLILLPGALGTAEVFFRVLDAMERDCRLVAVTFPAIGDAQALATRLLDFLDAIGIGRFHLLGTSLGGYVAQIVALVAPARIATLVLANTFADPTQQQARWPAAADYATQAEADVLVAARRQLEAGEPKTTRAAELKSTMLSLVGSEQGAADVKAMRLAVLTAVPLPVVSLPAESIVLVDDSEDPVIARETRDALRSRYAGSRHIDIAGGGHFPANLQPDAYVAALRSAIGVAP